MLAITMLSDCHPTTIEGAQGGDEKSVRRRHMIHKRSELNA